MKAFIISVIAVLGIALAASVARNVTLERKLNENNTVGDDYISKAYVREVVGDLLYVTNSYVEKTYGECLYDTIWEDDEYDELCKSLDY